MSVTIVYKIRSSDGWIYTVTEGNITDAVKALEGKANRTIENELFAMDAKYTKDLPPVDMYQDPHMPQFKTLEQAAMEAAEFKGLKYNPSPAGIKHDSDKLPLELLDPTALEGLTAVLAFGAKKYAPNNWRQGFKYSRLLAALLRHTFALMKGERIDPESGLPHIDHIGCCWMFLSNMMKTRADLDDLPATQSEVTQYNSIVDEINRKERERVANPDFTKQYKPQS